jgi:ankyrin repeat protein
MFMPVYDLSKKMAVEKMNTQIVIDPLYQVQQDKACGKHVMLNAVKNGQLDQVKVLINMGIPYDPKEYSGGNPLFVAILRGHKDIVNYFLSLDADPNTWWSEPKLGSIIFNLKHSSSRVQIIKTLISKGWNVNLPDNEGNTFLMWAAHHGYFEEVKILVDAGAKISFKSNSGSTAFFRAAEEGYLDILEFFIAKCPEDIIRLDGINALKMACQENKVDVVRCLLKKGVEVSKTDDIFLYHQFGLSYELVELLLNAGANLNIQDHMGTTPLGVAALWGQVDIIKLLIAHRVNVDIREADGSTPLINAAQNGDLQVVKVLLEAGAEINAIDVENKTALDYAREGRHKTVAHWLIRRGGSWSVCNIEKTW